MAITANRYLTLFLLFAASAISYSVGFIIGFWLFIVVGVIFELVFWVELFTGKRRPIQPVRTPHAK